MLSLKPRHPTGYRTILTEEQAAADWRLRGAWLLDVYPDRRYEANEYMYLPAGWLDPVIAVGEHYTPAAYAGLRRLGYRFVSRPADTFDEIWALQPHRALLKLRGALNWHRAARWAWHHRLIATRAEPYVFIRLRDLRPNLRPFNRGCRNADRSVI